MERRAFCQGLVGLLTTGLAACGKTDYAPDDVSWIDADFDLARARALALGRPVMLFFGATWDTGSKQMGKTFREPEVCGVLSYGYVAVFVDVSDDERPATRRAAERFRVIGTPTTLVTTSTLDAELVRFNEVVYPRRLATALRIAKRKHDALFAT
ncbi:MAG: thioredoxin family protein [Labilithrix sp.]|nr:thioredoxin family protein [Labilithrix sp.]